MSRFRCVFLLFVLAVAPAVPLHGEILVRWDQAAVPSVDSLGVSALVIPANNAVAIRSARRQGYRVYLQADAAEVAKVRLSAERVEGIVLTGTATPAQLQAWRRRMPPGARILSTMQGGKWPHIRLNWVTLKDDVLQVASRTAQPWVENNGAIIGVERQRERKEPEWLTYSWEPITVSDMHQGPSLEDYLVAIAEAGTFGGDLVLPLHETFERDLLLGRPTARADWREIRRYIEFYSWDLPRRYESARDIGVITHEPLNAYETLNLLTRHNLPFEVIDPADLPARKLDDLALLVVIDRPGQPQIDALTRFARAGGTVVVAGLEGPFPWQGTEPVRKTDRQATYRVGDGLVVQYSEAIADPNRFALEVRELIAPEKRVLDIWNGITVLATPYRDQDGRTLLVSLLNYAHEPLPVQLRVRGAYSAVYYESPDAEAVLIPFQQRDGRTEFVLPALRVGARVFLSRDGTSN